MHRLQQNIIDTHFLSRNTNINKHPDNDSMTQTVVSILDMIIKDMCKGSITIIGVPSGGMPSGNKINLKLWTSSESKSILDVPYLATLKYLIHCLYKSNSHFECMQRQFLVTTFLQYKKYIIYNYIATIMIHHQWCGCGIVLSSPNGQ